MSAKQPLADPTTSPNTMVCRDVLALMDRVSLVNGLQPVREIPMSLLENTAWTSPNVWIRAVYCSATFSATLSCLNSVVPTQAEGSTRCRRAKQHGGPHTLLRRSHARHCCLPVELFIQFRIFRDLSFQVAKWVSVQVHIMSRFISAEITVRPPAETPQRKRAGPSSLEQFESKNAEQAPRMNGSSSPFACALATT